MSKNVFCLIFIIAFASKINSLATKNEKSEISNTDTANVAAKCQDGVDENDAGLCYTLCKSGYTGVGPVCWQTCPGEYIDGGVFCYVLADTYGKGCCCTVFGCCGGCKDDYTDFGCTCTN